MQSSAWMDRVVMLGLFAFGLLLCLHYGQQALHPLDSSIVFDGAWRRMQGQQWMSDFSSPNGFTPIAIQTLFFRLFGVNFFAYFLHAAVFNGLFALIAFRLLRRVGAERFLAATYAGLSAVVFYPPMGAPYMEQHAFFFVLLTVWLCLESAFCVGRRRMILLACVPASILLAILSKQIPGGFALIFALLLVPIFHRKLQLREMALGLAAGLPLALLVYVLVMGVGGFDFAALWEATVALPGDLGRERLAEWQGGPAKTVRTLAWLPFQVLAPLNGVNRWLLYLPLLAAGISAVIARLRGGKGLLRVQHLRLLAPAILMVVACSLFIKLTQNQMGNGLPFVFVALGLGHLVWRKTLLASGAPVWLAGLFSAALLAYHLWGGWHFNAEVNAPRKVLDFQAASLPPATAQIGCLEYRAVYGAGELRPDSLLAFLAAEPGNFFLFGDQTWLYGLSGRPSIGPALWWHFGLTLPWANSPAFAEVDRRLLAQVQAASPRWVILEHAEGHTYMDVGLADFPLTWGWLRARFGPGFRVGGFWVWELE